MSNPNEPTNPVSVTASGAEPGITAMPAPNELARCVVIMNRQKTPVTAHINEPGVERPLYSAIQLSSQAEGPALNAKGEPAGTLKVNRMPSDLENSHSQLPISCSVDGKTYPVKVPENVERRIFFPSGPLNP